MYISKEIRLLKHMATSQSHHFIFQQSLSTSKENMTKMRIEFTQISTPQRSFTTTSHQVRIERRLPSTPKVKKEDQIEPIDWNFPKSRVQRTPTPPTPALTTSASPCLLDVNIPSTEMERYSIMFGAFLAQANGESPTTATAPRASLYERRKSRDVLGNKEPPPRLFLEPLLKRHATTAGRITPTPIRLVSSNSPEIFGITTTCVASNGVAGASSKGTQKPGRRLGRSNTTAALNRDPRPGPGFVVVSNTPEDTDTFPLTAHEFFDTATNRKLGPFTATAITIGPADSRKRSGSEVSKVSVESSSISTPHGSFDDDEWFPHKKIDDLNSNTVVLRSTNPTGSPAVNDLNDASWEMVSAGTSPQPTREQEGKDEKAVMAAVELSIQRQISVSQRQLLLPVVKQRERRIGQPLPMGVKRVASAGQLRR
ncbi:hypothetical protein DFH27DRAFT_137189 [Peziza echinospora]|nr:hypothetical protein DFH27DRAFT_137189 [Peziza echinospora]